MSDIITILPLVGIIWNGEKIFLSDSREKVTSVLGEPYEVYKNKYYYNRNELRFDFDVNGTIEFIEFLAGIRGQLQPEIYGVSAFGTDASVLYKILKDKNDGDIDDSERGYSYGFLNTSVGIFRLSTPDSVAEMIEEAENEGDPMDADEIEYEMQKATHWATIGIGVKNCYQ